MANAIKNFHFDFLTTSLIFSRRSVGAPGKWWKMITFSRRSFGYPCESREMSSLWSCVVWLCVTFCLSWNCKSCICVKYPIRVRTPRSWKNLQMSSNCTQTPRTHLIPHTWAITPLGAAARDSLSEWELGTPLFPHVVDTDFLPNMILGGPAQITWPGLGAPQFPHSVDGLPPKSRNCDGILLLSLFSLSPAQRLAFRIQIIVNLGDCGRISNLSNKHHTKWF